MNHLPQPSEAQKITWALLGYKRWLPRKQARSENLASVQTSVSPAQERVQTQALPSAKMAPAKPAEKRVSFRESALLQQQEAQSLRLADGVLWADAEFTLLCPDQGECLWLLPTLCFDGKDYKLFLHAEEAILLSRALQYVGLSASAGLFAALAQMPMLEIVPGIMSAAALKQTLERRMVAVLGTEALARTLDRAEQVIGEKIPCVHPRRALYSPALKYQLWQNLENLKDKV